MDFQFNEAKHTYTMGDREIPSCTRALDHSGLVDFSMVRQEILERKSRLGTEVHRAVHYFLEGDLDIGSVDDEAMPYLQSFIKLLNHTKFVPELIEYQTIGNLDGLQFGMKLDLAGVFGGFEAILDLKTGQPAAHHGIQLAGYCIGTPHKILITPMAKFAKRRRFGIYLKADGSMPKVVPYTEQRDFRLFASALEIASWKMAQGKKIQPIGE